MKSEWVQLEAFGTAGSLKELAEGRFLVIRDDDAAAAGAPCWWARLSPGDEFDSRVEAEYEAAGGTVSATYIVVDGAEVQP